MCYRINRTDNIHIYNNDFSFRFYITCIFLVLSFYLDARRKSVNLCSPLPSIRFSFDKSLKHGLFKSTRLKVLKNLN